MACEKHSSTNPTFCRECDLETIEANRIKIGDYVTDDPAKVNHRGQVIAIRYNKHRDIDEAYVRWHKGYSSWMMVSRLNLKD